jgi:GTPase SAR1 family protein
MPRISQDSWSQIVGTVFDARPRVAIDDLSRWIKREEEAKLRSAICSPGIHCCLYGPSGSGKTSLVKTTIGRLTKKGKKFIYTRINHNTDWSAFKSQIIEDKTAHSKVGPFNYKIGLSNLLPTFELSGSRTDLGGFAHKSQLIDLVDIRHISNFLIANDICLVIDDVHFSSDSLLEMLTSLAKEITDLSYSDNAKIIFVGADDIYIRVLASNDSLRDRMEEIALGSIAGQSRHRTQKDKQEAWHFIASGLVTLGLADPRIDKYITKEQLDEIMRWVEYAADGLPKSIVMLGKKIAEYGTNRDRVSYNDIMNASKEMISKNFRTYRTTLAYPLNPYTY